ncbi:MAG: hypothetical protein ACTSWW_11050 [Promethearchaeota archaeon]
MKQEPISKRTWGIEFLRMLAASSVGSIFVVLLSLDQDIILPFSRIVLIYFIIVLVLAIFAMVSNIESYKYIFFLRPIFQELLKSNKIEQAEIKTHRKEVIRLTLIGSLTYGVIFTILMGWFGEENSFVYLLLLGIFATFFSTCFNYPGKYFKYISELCTPHLEEEAKEYIQLSEQSWWAILLQMVAIISVYFIVSPLL